MMIFVALALGVAVFGYTLAPVWYRRPEASAAIPPIDDPLLQLEARRATVYESIGDLDFELQMGKLTADDHAEVRGELMREAADVLRELDRHGADDDLGAWIESQVAARRSRGVDSAGGIDRPCPACQRPNPVGAGFCDGCGAKLAARTCDRCNATLRDDAKFCGGCGVST